MSVEEIVGKGSTCREAFDYFREQLKADPKIEETVEYEPLKEFEAPS